MLKSRLKSHFSCGALVAQRAKAHAKLSQHHWFLNRLVTTVACRRHRHFCPITLHYVLSRNN